MYCVESRWQASCDFEDPYLCGYQADHFGMSTWIYKQASDQSTVPGGPGSDGSKFQFWFVFSENSHTSFSRTVQSYLEILFLFIDDSPLRFSNGLLKLSLTYLLTYLITYLLRLLTDIFISCEISR